MKYFATSDWHYDHSSTKGGIIAYCQRPFASLKEMNKELIDRYNDTVDENSVVFDLGDLAMMSSSNVQFYEALAKKLRPVKARHLILGNHDQLKPQAYLDCGLYDAVHTSYTLNYKGLELYMAHDPCVYQPVIYNYVMLCGHIHVLYQHLAVGSGVLNVGVDVRDFRPVSFDELVEEQKLLTNR
jgi:calcineurin-like phosphoesterase family protein